MSPQNTRPYYLRVEAVNLGQFLDDTKDLSTIRGGGLLLLHVADAVHRAFRDLEPISRGASIGLFRFRATPEKADQLRQTVERWLQEHDHYGHATFVVDVSAIDPGAGSDGERAARERVISKNRLRQFRQPTLVVPAQPSEGQRRALGDAVERRGQGNPDRVRKYGQACRIDCVRPATELVHLPDDGTSQKSGVSRSVDVRRDYGRKARDMFYAHECEGLDVSLPDGFSQSFQELAGFAGERTLEKRAHRIPGGRAWSRLAGKMAVIYLDGNKFGGIQRGLDEKGLNTWDKTLRDNRRKLLADLLTAIHGPSEAGDGAETDPGRDWFFDGAEGLTLRFETLLWGGDELIWVVPAWQGWRTLAYFFEHAKGWTFDGPLTHAGGLVFCSCKAPIQQILKLARSKLAEAAKEAETQAAFLGDAPPSAPDGGRGIDLIAYETLESFDFVGDDFDAHRRRSVPFVDGTRDVHRLLLPGAKMTEIGRLIGRLRDAADCEEFSKTQLNRLVSSVLRGPVIGTEDLEGRLITAVGDERKSIRDALVRLAALCGGREISWIHLLKLWDYVPIPEPIGEPGR